MAGRHTQAHPARRELVDTRDRMRSDGRNPRARNCDPGAQLDSLRVGRGECERRVAVRPEHLRVRNPATVIAKFLAVARELPFIAMSIDANSKFHRVDLFLDPRLFSLTIGTMVFSNKNSSWRRPRG